MNSIIKLDDRIEDIDLKEGNVEATKDIIKTNYNKNELLKEIIKQKNKLYHLENLLISAEKNLDNFNELKLYISGIEGLLMMAKRLDLYQKSSNNTEIIDINDTQLDVSEYSLVIKNDDYFVYKLPQMIGKRHANLHTLEGFFIQNIVIKLTQNELKKCNFNFKKMENALVVFEHHLQKNSDKNNSFDPDNIDAKRALDGINGLVLEDDTIENIDLIHTAVLDNEEHTILHVVRKNSAKKWIIDNLHLFE